MLVHDRDFLVRRTLVRMAVASEFVNGYTTFTPECCFNSNCIATIAGNNDLVSQFLMSRYV
jgi:hypothetical protein